MSFLCQGAEVGAGAEGAVEGAAGAGVVIEVEGEVDLGAAEAEEDVSKEIETFIELILVLKNFRLTAKAKNAQSSSSHIIAIIAVQRMFASG